MVIVQGSAFALEFKVQGEDGEAFDIACVDKIEICVGELRKLYDGSDSSVVTYDSERGVFSFPLSQQETIDMDKSAIQYQIRVKYNNGQVVATIPETIEVITSIGATGVI